MRRIALLLPLVLAACQHAPERSADEVVLRAMAIPANDAPAAEGVISLGPSSRYIETRNLTDVADVIRPLPPATTLVVFDIDDTLLSTAYLAGKSGSREFFGSDAWYNWQRDLPDGDPHKQACRFAFLGMNFEGEVGEPTVHAAKAVASVTLDKLILTSRSPDYRGGTERELKLSEVPFPAPITTEPALTVYFNKTPMTYSNGILMTRGADKGKALEALLKSAQRPYTDVVLVDDGWKNILDMSDASAAAGRQFHGVLYNGVKRDINAGVVDREQWKKYTLSDDQKQQAQAAWDSWMQRFAQLYPERASRLTAAGECK
ncbi:DUF2608 domain-containing protein [Tahibacter amnicola]|uniref:DUF2608 domain-containing protein n=1 Tax=Tahibacter amnicola TaxID=2976241 RepID=A0ABY6B8Q5_9GAMM|nr:DUF2608 domain-containing protein [Tahibacter amnicola]UXI66254.1 DUF2608 domain-containing protein [Tahibacter amnicola]